MLIVMIENNSSFKQSGMKSDNHNEKQLQFQFDLEIQKIKLLNSISIPKMTYLEVIWRRGQKNISTNIKPEITGNEQEIVFGETLSMISTCTLNLDTLEFTPKQSIVSAVIYISGSQKLFGSLTINLGSVLNGRNYYDSGVRLIEEELNGRAKSKIYLKLSSSYLKEKIKGDDQSIGSGVTSQYNNTSTYSIDRRLTEIPSKDTFSVMSYGGAIRYSNRKDATVTIRREDSAKKMQDPSKQYGRYGGYSQQNFYAKPTNEYHLAPSNQATIQGVTTQGSSNIKSISSIQSSANRIARNSDSQNNKSTAGEQSTRLLAEEQTKRSRLEAELAKNKVENQELKSKLSQYVRENMKLKEDTRRVSQNNDSKQAECRKENEELRQRNYVLINEVRQLKNRFEKYTGLQKQCQNLKMEKQTYQREAKRYEDVSNHFQRQLQQARNQLNRSKENQTRINNEIRQLRSTKVEIQDSKKRQMEAKIKELNGQVEYYHNSCKNLSVLLREAQEKARNFEREVKSQENKVQMMKSEENRKFNDLVMNKEKEIRQINEKLSQKSQQCTKYIVEAQKFKNQYGKVKDQRIAELENNRLKQVSQIERLQAGLKQANSRVEQFQSEKAALNGQLHSQFLLRSRQSEKVKQLQQKLALADRNLQKQIMEMRRTAKNIEMQNVQLNKILSDKSRALEQAGASRQEVEQLMKHNLQLQLEIKYKSDECLRLSRVEQELESIKCKLTIQEGNNREISQVLEKTQKQLKEKNRACILEAEKSKMLLDERINQNKNYSQIKEELQRSKLMIQNGERQFQDMKQCIEQLQNRNHCLIQQIRSLQSKLVSQNTDKYTAQIKSLQSRIRELEQRDSQKIKTMETLHRSLSSSSKQIKQLQVLSEQRYELIESKDKSIADLDQKIKDFQSTRLALQSELNAVAQDKKNLAKKNQMIMEELFSYKKRFEEERGRSTSTIQMRSSEDYMKIKNLENELQKRQDKIRKMQKEMIALENENVNLSIQVMKKLQDITPK